MVDKIITSHNVISAIPEAGYANLERANTEKANTERANTKQEERKKTFFQLALIFLLNEWLKKLILLQQVLKEGNAAGVSVKGTKKEMLQLEFTHVEQQVGTDLAQKLKELERKLDNVLQQMKDLSELIAEFAVEKQVVADHVTAINTGLTQIEASSPTLGPTGLIAAIEQVAAFGKQLQHDLVQTEAKLKKTDELSGSIERNLAEITTIMANSNLTSKHPTVDIAAVVEGISKYKQQSLAQTQQLRLEATSVKEDLTKTIDRNNMVKQALTARLLATSPYTFANSNAPRPSYVMNKEKDEDIIRLVNQITGKRG